MGYHEVFTERQCSRAAYFLKPLSAISCRPAVGFQSPGWSRDCWSFLPHLHVHILQPGFNFKRYQLDNIQSSDGNDPQVSHESHAVPLVLRGPQGDSVEAALQDITTTTR